MRPPNEHAVRELLARALADLLRLPLVSARVEAGTKEVARPDLVLTAGKWRFSIEYKPSATAAMVAGALEQLTRRRAVIPDALPLLVVPFMGEVGREKCGAAGVHWMDLSGNACIMTDELRVNVEGRPNRFKRPGRPSNVLARRSARIARWLLIHPERSFPQRELVQLTGLSRGFLSAVVRRLTGDKLVVRHEDGGYQVRDPDLLLDAWRERYAFTAHTIIKGHVAARSGLVLFHQLAQQFIQAKVGYAATGLGPAWLLTHFANFRTATFYLEQFPHQELVASLRFTEDPHGANVWLVVPNDVGVFHGASEVEGIRCVHPVQLYLDLLGHAERSKEAAQHLRETLLTWERAHA